MACSCKNKKSSVSVKTQVRRTTIASNGKSVSTSKKMMRREIK